MGTLKRSGSAASGLPLLGPPSGAPRPAGAGGGWLPVEVGLLGMDLQGGRQGAPGRVGGRGQQEALGRARVFSVVRVCRVHWNGGRDDRCHQSRAPHPHPALHPHAACVAPPMQPALPFLLPPCPIPVLCSPTCARGCPCEPCWR